MIIVSREQAACLFYAVEHNEENKKKYTESINEMQDVEICYTSNPRKPRLLCTRVINANSFDIHLYQTESQLQKPLNPINQIAKLETKPQVIQYLNTVYKSQENGEQYENKLLSAADILHDVWQHATIFLDKNPDNFSNWCSRNKLDYLGKSPKRPGSTSKQRTSQRSLYVLKEELKRNVVEDIISLERKHQDYMIDLKTNGYTVIGYCRKSKATKNTEDEVVKSLSGMVLGLQKRSLVDEIYVTVSCNASTRMFKRDMKKNDIINKLSGVSGTAQDLIKRLKETKNFCLVVIDSSGLTTNMDDLIDVMREYTNLKKIIIENIVNANDVQVLDCEDELITPKRLHSFNRRQNLYHRSKNN